MNDKLIYPKYISVTASWKEPYPGWVEGMNGPTGLMVGAARGWCAVIRISDSISRALRCVISKCSSNQTKA